MSEKINERDLVLTPTTYAHVLDKTQGEVVTYVGPIKVSLADSDQPVVFDYKTKTFKYAHLQESIQNNVIAPEGWYTIIKNPSLVRSAEGEEEGLRSPGRGKNETQMAKLEIGHKVNIPGPTSWALWPGQMIRLVEGHHLRSNQYLLVRVYDESAARKYRDQAVIVTEGEDDLDFSLIPEDLTTGKQFIIRGTDVSFFIPPTGIEVVRDGDNDFIRDAETLELLEYCILLDESGDKRFVIGPSVVFPQPTEEFVTKKGHRKFTAFELNDMSGLYIKVIKEYVSKGLHHDGNAEKTKVPVGTELFITGKTTPVYFPCEEHAIIQYGDNKKINYAVAIPSGTGRYVLNRKTGVIESTIGPNMLLADPRYDVMIRRILSEREANVMFPGNTEALAFNLELSSRRVGSNDYALADAANIAYSTEASVRSLSGQDHASGPVSRSKRKKALKDYAGDQMVRGTSHTPPRTITLDNKYDGVVSVDVWTGYAVNVVNKDGSRRVVKGPTTLLLDYDETLESFYLSRSTPKNNKNRKEDVYLRINNNRVTDLIKTHTKDLVGIDLVLSFRVNFKGDESKWFNVDDYVGLLTDHMRSVIRNEVQKHGVKEFWENKIDILRDCVLGKTNEDGDRGREFKQNDMVIYDVDFVDATIKDAAMSNALVNDQHESIVQDLDLERNRRQLVTFMESEEIKRARLSESDVTSEQATLSVLAKIKRDGETVASKIETDRANTELQLGQTVSEQDFLERIQVAELTRQESQAALRDKIDQASLKLRLDEINAVAEAEIKRVRAIEPNLIAAMQTLGHSEMVAKLTENLSPLAIMGGTSVADVVRNIFKGTGLEGVIENLPNLPSKTNGKVKHV